ncbi:MAG: hypothetical protein ACOC7S_03005 [Planctomycetota bacterium]
MRAASLGALLVAGSLMALGCTAQGGRAAQAAQDENLRAAFHGEYKAYREAPLPERFSSMTYSPEQLVHLQNMAEMGPGVLPYLVDEARKTGDANLTLPLGIISRLSFRRAGWSGAEDIGSREELQLFIQWWDAGQARTNQMFGEAYADGDMKRIAALGVAALPLMMDKLKEGDTRMLQCVRQVAVGQPDIPESTTSDADSSLEWWQTNKQKWIVPFPDQGKVEPPPVKK